MRSQFLSIVFLFIASFGLAQEIPEAPLPAKFLNLNEALVLNHFPKVVHPVAGEGKESFAWYWKHNTAVLAPERCQVLEAGAYIFIGHQWTLRTSFTPKEFSRLFACPDGKLSPGQPYTFMENWRTDHQLRAGWAAWYVLATNAQGDTLFGWQPIYTSNQPLNSK